MPITTLHTPSLSPTQQDLLTQSLSGELEQCAGFYRLHHARSVSPKILTTLRQQLPFDVNTLPEQFDPAAAKLLVSDMDSTLIAIECVDEIADIAGVKPQVAALTESAMRGEIGFLASLIQRVKLLEGQNENVLQQVYNDHLQLNPGAETLIGGLKKLGIKFALVSGGFTFFTDRLYERLALDFSRANELEIIDGRLTGNLTGKVIDSAAKREFLLELCEQMHISPSQTIAMGDGANDLKMMESAGMSVAYHAKPEVQAAADVVINHSGLDSVLALLKPVHS